MNESSVSVSLKEVMEGTAVIEVRCNVNELLFGTYTAMLEIYKGVGEIINSGLVEKKLYE
jgi:hypothetical protein